jgi:enoyl-CoA hydratase
MYNTLRIEEHGRATVLYFNRPDKLNAINREVYGELANFLDRIARGDTNVEVLILSGEGRAFVAGADIDDYLTMTLQEFSAFQRLGFAVMQKIRQLQFPVIAAVNGYAFGGGFEIALTCDISIASENAKMGLPEAKLGLLPGGGGTQTLSRIVGAQIAKRMIMCGETIDAARAQSLGIVSEVVPKGDAVASAMALAQTMLANGPLAIRLAKRVIDEGLEASLYTALNFEMDSTALLFVTDDKREGIEAFNEKRTPVFAGK